MGRPRHSRPSVDDLDQWRKDGSNLEHLPVPAARNEHDHGAYVKLDPDLSQALALSIDRDWIEQLDTALSNTELNGMFSSRAQLMRACIAIGAARLIGECDPKDTYDLRRRYLDAELAAERRRAQQRREDRDHPDPRVQAMALEYDVLFGSPPEREVNEG